MLYCQCIINFNDGGHMASVMDNTGGRIDLQVGSEVRIIDNIGKISDDVYIVRASRSDRKGHVLLEKDGVSLKVHYKRIMQKESHGKAVCVESAGHYSAVCPECAIVIEIEPNSEQLICNVHGPKSIIWTGVKPTSTKQSKTPRPKNSTQKVSKLKGPKKMKQITVNLDDLAKLPNCELYSLTNVKFDHARVEVNAHTLIFVGPNPRKLCFNTYNGCLGKKSAELPIAEFLADNRDSKQRWYPIKDIEKTRDQLVKSGYERR